MDLSLCKIDRSGSWQVAASEWFELFDQNYALSHLRLVGGEGELTPETLRSLHAPRTCAKTVYGAGQPKGCAKDRLGS
jgi:hypothetical protein